MDGFVRELDGRRLEAVAAGQAAPELAGDLARQALSLCLAEVESVRKDGVVELV